MCFENNKINIEWTTTKFHTKALLFLKKMGEFQEKNMPRTLALSKWINFLIHCNASYKWGFNNSHYCNIVINIIKVSINYGQYNKYYHVVL